MANLTTTPPLPLSTSSDITGPTIVLHRPQIPQNTGNISRLCVAIRSPLVITGKAGFQFDTAAVRRAGLDHWEHLKFTHYKKFRDLSKAHPTQRLLAITKSGQANALTFDYTVGDVLVFGNETMGLPPALLKRLHHTLYLPMTGPVRSLNLSNSVAVVAYAYLNKVYGDSLDMLPDAYPRTYFKRRTNA